MSLSVKDFKYRTIETTNVIPCPKPIHPSPLSEGGGFLGRNNKKRAE